MIFNNFSLAKGSRPFVPIEENRIKSLYNGFLGISGFCLYQPIKLFLFQIKEYDKLDKYFNFLKVKVICKWF